MSLILSLTKRWLGGWIIFFLILVVSLMIYSLKKPSPQETGYNPDLCSLEVVRCEGEADVGLEAENSPQGLVATHSEGICSFYDYDLRTKDQVCRSDDCWSKNHRTVASRDFKRGTMLIVENIDNGKSVEVFTNDYVENEKVICDLSSAAFKELALLKQGLIKVRISNP